MRGVPCGGGGRAGWLMVLDSQSAAFIAIVALMVVLAMLVA